MASTISYHSESTLQNHSPTETASLSPLAAALEESHLSGRKNYSMNAFSQWVTAINLPPGLGVLHSASLHRESGYLHHEYVLMCFYEKGGRESWLRAERAARFKRHHLQGDSFGPIIGGAVLRETITVASNKAELTSGDEIASIDLSSAIPAGDTIQGQYHLSVYFKDAIRILSANSAASDKYRLFSENCRWFARRTMLSLLERLSESGSTAVHTWRSGRIDSVALASVLHHEWAGGKQLDGWKSALINASNLRRLARSAIVDRRFDAAITFCNAALDRLKTVPKGESGTEKKFLEASLWLSLGDALQHLGRLNQAIAALNTSVTICRNPELQNLYLAIISLEALALCHSELGQYDEALKLQLPLVDIVRKSHLERQEEHAARVRTRLLSNTVMFQLQAAQSSRPIPENAITLIAESVEVARELFAEHPEVYQFTLADALRLQALVFNSVGEFKNATNASRDAIALLRKALSSYAVTQTVVDMPNPIMIDPDFLPSLLINHMKFAAQDGLTEEGLAAGREAVDVLRALVYSPPSTLEHPDRIKAKFGSALYYLGVHLRAANHDVAESIELWREAATIYRDLSQRNPGLHHDPFAQALYHLGQYTSDLPILQESVSESRRAYELTHGASSLNQLALGLTEYAVALGEHKLWTDACAADEESIRHLKALSPENNRLMIAAISSNLGRYQFEDGRHGDALATFEAASKEWQVLYQKDPSTHRGSYIRAAQFIQGVSTTLGTRGYPAAALHGYQCVLRIWAELGATEQPGYKTLQEMVERLQNGLLPAPVTDN